MANTLFKSQTQQDLGVIRAKLDMAEARLAQLERDAPAASLRLHLGTAQDGDADLVAQLPIARDERDQLVLALGAAEQLEADRKSAARHKALGSKVRAGQQHLSRIERSMHEVEAAAANMISSFARAVESTRGVYALFPHLHMDNITPGRLGRLAQAALVNASRTTGAHIFDARHAPWMADFEQRSTSAIAPLDALLNLEAIRGQLRNMFPNSPAVEPHQLADDEAAGEMAAYPVSPVAPPSTEDVTLEIDEAAP